MSLPAPDFLQTIQVETPSMLPTDAQSSIMVESNYREQWGIDNLLDGYIVQSENMTETPITDTTQGQKGEVVAELDYDKRYDLTLTVIGGTSTTRPIIGTTPNIAGGQINFQYPVGTGHIYKLSNVVYQGTYNAKKVYTLTGYRYANWPSQS